MHPPFSFSPPGIGVGLDNGNLKSMGLSADYSLPIPSISSLSLGTTPREAGRTSVPGTRQPAPGPREAASRACPDSRAVGMSAFRNGLGAASKGPRPGLSLGILAGATASWGNKGVSPGDPRQGPCSPSARAPPGLRGRQARTPRTPRRGRLGPGPGRAHASPERGRRRGRAGSPVRAPLRRVAGAGAAGSPR